MRNMGNMNKMMKQVQKMQKNMAKLQEELKEKTVEATAGGGVVKAIASGRKQLVKIEISPEVVDPDDIEMLQDLVLAAANEALQKAEDMVATEMEKVTGGINIPGLY
ncbi:MAG TPA: YbaB/EbfC family nucleoid-associated protein [Thermoanaerobacterales bacterium]|jgi:DNA-binding YbaB/EbfC family protein|nr:YbaB/EbfC family nucleoid-associated protein [Thermoanaerobacterales bacterium]